MSDTIHRLRAEQSQRTWDNEVEPELVISSGESVGFAVQDASAGQITPQSTVAALTTLDSTDLNPITGPVFVEGAEPGDVLQVDILELRPEGFGWTAQIPGFGLLADEFPDPWLHIWQIDGPLTHLSDGIAIPVQPMCGVLGVAPGDPGEHSIIPPRRVGGNMDIRQLGERATLYLPIEVSGALFSVGDTHAAQGDGEVCGTAIEAPMSVDLRLTVRRDMHIDAPEAEIRRPLERPSAAQAGYYVTTGIESDLMEAAKQATRAMIVRLVEREGISREMAYALCSVAHRLVANGHAVCSRL